MNVWLSLFLLSWFFSHPSEHNYIVQTAAQFWKCLNQSTTLLNYDFNGQCIWWKWNDTNIIYLGWVVWVFFLIIAGQTAAQFENCLNQSTTMLNYGFNGQCIRWKWHKDYLFWLSRFAYNYDPLTDTVLEGKKANSHEPQVLNLLNLGPFSHRIAYIDTNSWRT